MTRKRKWILVNTLMLTAYFLASTPYYLLEMSKLENFAITATLYFAFVVIHEIFIFFALATQWLGYLFKMKIWIFIATVAMFIGGAVFFISLIVIIPMVVINIFSMEKHRKSTENSIEGLKE